ncbi:hypothetical protein NEOLEDRAFT_1174950 [Neolentinus lepideus HHB14362 ss-1]|uniref:Uncharacterized protein n=1 Tax=Neolentinus lepideus HHB14362 ss-1 TaxID=1314782 RepID=A0A165V6I9_9AGAM|nr:hypothetical protein NEOLEDRAFT_1174950 [Neolentinus lepideus HHB14362 ss-1]
MASVAMAKNGLAARSPSPIVDRSKAPVNAFYNPTSGSPTIPNGYGHIRPGSTGKQEAAYYRAKLAAYEASAEGDLSRIEHGRVLELERQLSSMMSSAAVKYRKIAELDDSLALQTTLLEEAEARAADSSKRAEMMEESHEKVVREHSSLSERAIALEAAVRDHADQLLMHKSALEQKEAEHAHLESEVEELSHSLDQDVRALEQTRAALEAASSRSDEVDAQQQRTWEQLKQMESDFVDLHGELEARTSEVEALRRRLVETENSWARSREEADAFRVLTTGSIGELLDSHRRLKADEDRMMWGHAEKIHVLDEETISLRVMLKESLQPVAGSNTAFSAQPKKLYHIISNLEDKIKLHEDNDGVNGDGSVIRDGPTRGGGVVLKARNWKDPKEKSEPEKLADMMHNLLEISPTPSAPASLRNILQKYIKILHLWTHGFHKLLESLCRSSWYSVLTFENLQMFLTTPVPSIMMLTYSRRRPWTAIT